MAGGSAPAPAATLAGHVNVVTSLALHSRRTTAGVGQRRGEIRVWDLEREVDLHTLRGSEWIDALAFSRDGRLLASGGTEDLVRMWDPRAGVSVGAFGRAAAVTPVERPDKSIPSTITGGL